MGGWNPRGVDCGFSNDWWGRDPIEQAEGEPMGSLYTSDVFWDGPEYEPETADERADRLERLRRLERGELQTRILENNNNLLADICDAFRKEWTKQ